MSKFQVGDKAKVKFDDLGREWEVTVRTTDVPEGCVTHYEVKTGDCVVRVVPEYALEPIEPHVPDVDGNPIRVGALVENADRPWEIRRVRMVNATSETVFDFETIVHDGADQGYHRAEDWRVVDSTFRPPEPGTRDVTLRVTVTVPASLHPDHFDGLLSDMGDSWGDDVESATVEVVEPHATALFLPGGFADPDNPSRAELEACWRLTGPDIAPAMSQGVVESGQMIREPREDR